MGLRPLGLALLLVAAPAGAQQKSGTHYSPNSASNAVALEARKFRRQMIELREEAIQLRAADGGTLSPDQAAMLQKRLDALHARHADYQRPGCLGSHIECNDGP